MKWIIAALIVFSAGWMVFDGSRALIIGDYVTPESGEYAGQLGAWASVMQSLGIDPRSTFVKVVFVVYGLSALTALAGFVTRQPWGRSALVIMAVLGLWYLPFGTAANILVLMLLFFSKG